MKFIDLFAGIGGMRRGMELAGHKCVGFCEFDKFAAASYTSMHLITDEQRDYLSQIPLKQRQQEILKEEYRNGEWYSNDIRDVRAGAMPLVDCWCFGAPCQDFSIAGKHKGLAGDKSSLIREVFRILWEIPEEDRPEWLVYENVKGMFSSNGGWDYLEILLEMDKLGYDLEWQIFNSKYYVPQNRERVYTVGHLRGKGSRKIFPITPPGGEDSVGVELIGHREGYRRNTQIFAPEGIVEALDTAAGGGREKYTIIKVAGMMNGGRSSRNRVILADGIAPCVRGTDYKDPTRVVIPVLTPERANKRQNGRRFKEDGDESFTLTAQDRHGVAIEVDGVPHKDMYIQLDDFTVWAVWSERYQCHVAIRKLTPREYWRLQGWTDDYYDRAAMVNSDSQLYKQAGNAVTVDVVYEIGRVISEL